MTTPAAAALYEAQHVHRHEGLRSAVFNPHGKPLEELPVMFGFNNGGALGWLSAELLAEDGTHLGGHVCSSEAYMPADLGVLEGTRGDRHEKFREHYPSGYRMEFVRGEDVGKHAGLEAACRRSQEKAQAKTAGEGGAA